jgi:hypothetical protein
MTTYRLLKELQKKTESPDPGPTEPAPDPVAPEPESGASMQFSRFLVFTVAAGFLGCFWLIFQLAGVTREHEVRFQRLINTLTKQEAALRVIDQKITVVSSELPGINEDIAALSRKTGAAVVEVAKLGDIVAGQSQMIEGLKQQAVSVVQEQVK